MSVHQSDKSIPKRKHDVTDEKSDICALPLAFFCFKFQIQVPSSTASILRQIYGSCFAIKTGD